MNELQHCVTKFIDESGVCNSFAEVILKMQERYLDNKEDQIFNYFRKNSVNFTRLLEEMTDNIFKMEDGEITEEINSIFSDSALKEIDEYDEIFAKIEEKQNPYIPFLMLISMLFNKNWPSETKNK